MAVVDIVNPRLYFNVYGTYDNDGTVTASNITVTLIASISVNNSNQLVVNVDSVSSTTPNI